MQYRTGSFTTTSTPTARNITLGFRPSKFILTNDTGFGTNSVKTQAIYFDGMPAASALLYTNDGSAQPVQSRPTSNGFTIVENGAVYASTNYTITGITNANPGVVTVSSGTGLVDGQVGTISGVVGMTEVNTIRVVVTNVDTGAGTFDMYDLFGNKINTSSYTTYSSGGIFNLFATSPPPPTAFPALQYDTGSIYITLGTGLFNSAAETWYWEAFFETPTGY